MGGVVCFLLIRCFTVLSLKGTVGFPEREEAVEKLPGSIEDEVCADR